MPVNKNQQIRANILNECLSNFVKMYSIDDLLNKVNDYLVNEAGMEPVSKRTIYSDLDRLQNPDLYNAELEKKTIDRVVYYRYKHRNFSIHNTPITSQQLSELQHILGTLEQVSNFPFGKWLDTIRENSALASRDNYQEKMLIGIDHNPDLTGIHHFTDLFQALINEQVLSIDYRDFSGTDYTFVFHPYYLKQYNQRWFLIGLNESNPDTIWNLALDRIQKFRTIPRAFIPTRINFEDYFYDIIGVTHNPDAQPVEILLRFAPESLPYVLTKPLHPSQKTRKKGGDILILIKVKPNYELYSVLRSFGKNVEILGPPSVRETFIQELRETVDLYEGV